MAFKVLVVAAVYVLIVAVAASPLEEKMLDLILAAKLKDKGLSEGVRICEIDRNGAEHCRSLADGANNGENARSQNEGVRICETDRNGIDHCRPLTNSGANAMSQKEGVRICETDKEGIEHCRSLPVRADNGSKKTVTQQGTECFCVRDHYGHKICEPKNCDANRVLPNFP